MFDPVFPVARLRPAAYNPRIIGEDARAALRASIQRFGFCKPVLCTTGGLLVAGHQRSQAARALGLETVPAWVMANVAPADEMRFNQLHNGADLDDCDKPVRVPPGLAASGFAEVPPDAIDCAMDSEGAHQRAEIAKLVLKYGPWGCVVATQSGRVVSSPQYAIVCRQLAVPCRVYYVPDTLEDDARQAFARAYGEFSYAHLPRTPWLQAYAQPYRLRGDGTVNRAQLYEDFVKPQLRPGERVLDFGCGQGDYVAALARAGVDILGVEFYRRARGNDAIDVAAVRAMVDAALGSWRTHGGFDVVVCDSVVNSVDSVQAGADVLTCVAAMVRPGGRVYLSGRSREGIALSARQRTRVRHNNWKREVEFLDADGFSALYTRGGWTYQRFHTVPQAHAFGPRYFGGAPTRFVHRWNIWQAVFTSRAAPPASEVEAALTREFDLPWPGETSVGRAKEAVAAYRAALERDHGNAAHRGAGG
jgi:ParB family chromosome partitioning protein